MATSLFVAGAAVLALGAILAIRGYVAIHRRPYVSPKGERLIHAGAGFVGVGIMLSVSAVFVWLVAR